MLFDALNRFSYKQSVATGTTVSENIIDLQANRDLAVFTNLEVAVVAGTETSAALEEGVGTLSVVVETSETEDFAEIQTLIQTVPVTIEELNRDAIGIKLPYGGKRFLRLSYVAEGAPEGMLLTSGLVLATRHNILYPRAMHS